MSWHPERGTEVIVVPLDAPASPIRFRTDAFWSWHCGNAFERGGEIVVDYARYPDFSSFNEIGALTHAEGGGPASREPLGAARFHRAVIDPARRTFRSEELLASRACEFPKVHPDREGREHRHVWFVLDELSGLGRLDTRTGELVEHRAPSHVRVTEPIFVPRAGATDESDGHVLALCLDGPTDRSFLAIYDARRLEAGPVARCWFDHPIPITFHGTWAPAPA
jgi:all-trans-8'-apo-beta-carotenal 15,15'-oxygenase